MEAASLGTYAAVIVALAGAWRATPKVIRETIRLLEWLDNWYKKRPKH
jgi:hypothetical protein